MNCITTLQAIDLIKQKHDLESDYRLYKFTGWGQSTVSSYRVGKQFFSDAHAIQAAQLLELPAGYVMACIHAERAKKADVKAAWEATAAALLPDAEQRYILCQIGKRLPIGQFSLPFHDLNRLTLAA